MEKARSGANWEMLSWVLSNVANMNPYRTREFSPSEFNPLTKQRPVEIPKVPVSVLKTVFIDGKVPECVR